MEFLEQYKSELEDACMAHDVTELYIFGSILSHTFTDDSDIDFIVTIISDDPIEYAENYFELKFTLEKLFQRKIDLLEDKAIRNETFKSLIDQQKKLVYARPS